MITLDFYSECPHRLRSIVTAVHNCIKNEDARNIAVEAMSKGIAYWQGDSEQDAYDVLNQIVAYAEECGGRVIRLTSSDIIEMTNCADGNQHEYHGEGSFAFLVEDMR